MESTLSTYPTQVKKRDGRTVPFSSTKIGRAVEQALLATRERGPASAALIVDAVTERLSHEGNHTPTVEHIQDLVEEELMRLDFPMTAKAYILYRATRSEIRTHEKSIPEGVRSLAIESAHYFKDNPLGYFVYLRSYARWIPDEGRRETWVETVDRYVSFMRENLQTKLNDDEYQEIREAILTHEVMPSMRLMQFAGDPARRCNSCAYNCTFIAPTQLTDFAEIMYLSMQGCGVGFSVEAEHVEKLPQIARHMHGPALTHIIADSKEGWCDALSLGLETWYGGRDVVFDFSHIRPAGARLKTMGGKASGPEPLRSLLSFAREKIRARPGRRLRTIDVHDIICKIGECVVAGGVRRTAMISLSDLDDPELRDAKKGQFFLTDPHRSVANNSAVYRERPTATAFMDEWIALMKSGSGERGIFNRGALVDTLPSRRSDYFRRAGLITEDGVLVGPVGTNPCGEIILQSKQFCNLSEIIARPEDTIESLTRKARLAALLGTYQATLTSFRYVSREWTEHCEAERLLGVSITGQWDSAEVRKPETLRALRDVAIQANAYYAERFGINAATSVTAVKPSGTVSQTLNTSSGIHPRHAQFYIRRIRISATDSLFKLLKEHGVPYHPEVGQSIDTATTYVVEFPVAAPEGSTVRDDLSALEQLEYWKNVKLNYTEHNPSATISVGEDEWITVVNWVYRNWDIVGGLSFLPRSNHVYQLAPYETVSAEVYRERSASFPKIDYAELTRYEVTDETEQKRELACAGGTCEIEVLPTPTAV